MRLKTLEALKETSHKKLPQPKEGQSFVTIPTRNLLGYRGSETVYNAIVATNPSTVDGQPIKTLSELDMRPRIRQLPSESGVTLEPISATTTRLALIESQEQKAS